MKKLLTVSVWLFASIFIIQECFDIMNKATTFGFFVAITLIALIIYWSIKHRLGIKLLTKKNKE